MTPKTPTDHLSTLIRFHKWRRGEDDEIEQPDPKEIGDALDYAIQCCESIQSSAKTLRHDEITVPGLYLAKTPSGEIVPMTIRQALIDAGHVYMGLLYQGPIEWEEE